MDEPAVLITDHACALMPEERKKYLPLVVDADAEQPRAARLEISPSGPMFGYKMPLAQGEPGRLEREVLERRAAKCLLTSPVDFAGRDSQFRRELAVEYLAAAAAMEEETKDVTGLRRLATYCWRADEFLTQAEKLLQEMLQRRGVSSAPPGGEAPAGEGEAAPGGGAAAPAGPPGVIQSREDVILAIDRVIDYFNRCEPSSPIPLLLERAKRLVNKSFLEVMQDLGPELMGQLQSQLGLGK